MFHVFKLVFLFVRGDRFPKLKSLASIFCFRYGNHTHQIIRKYGKVDYSYRKMDLDVQFLDTCIREELCPTFLRHKISNKRLETCDA